MWKMINDKSLIKERQEYCAFCSSYYVDRQVYSLSKLNSIHLYQLHIGNNSINQKYRITVKAFFERQVFSNTQCNFVYCHMYLSIKTLRAVWYHLHNLKNVENTNGGLKLLVKSQAEACYFTESITPS